MPAAGQICANMNAKAFAQNWKYFLIASCTLGLAPFSPEPHIWGKIRWISGGAKGMQAIDWFDVFLHGTPWVLLVASLLILAYERFAKQIR